MYLVTGHGANVVFRDTPEGVILVNTKLRNPGDYERLVELIRGVAHGPVKYVLNSTVGPDATGNNAKFQTSGAAVVAGERAVKLGGIEARAIAFGDQTAVYFPADRVVYVGDLYPGGTAEELDALLKLDWTLAVPATGEPAYRAVLEAHRKTLR
jgi:glyoxylase-like metal-dependent hydrolase (beta-lactamase superfamily II)